MPSAGFAWRVSSHPRTLPGIVVACDGLADHLTEVRCGDKPHGATRRLTALDERLPETSAIAHALAPVVDQLLPDGWTVTEVAYRCPVPGTGGQQLHADDAPLLQPDLPASGATAIVALVPFTKENGATRVVPGSHRRVDQQRVSQKADHLPGEEYLLGKAGTAFVFSRHLSSCWISQSIAGSATGTSDRVSGERPKSGCACRRELTGTPRAPHSRQSWWDRGRRRPRGMAARRVPAVARCGPCAVGPGPAHLPRSPGRPLSRAHRHPVGLVASPEGRPARSRTPPSSDPATSTATGATSDDGAGVSRFRTWRRVWSCRLGPW